MKCRFAILLFLLIPSVAYSQTRLRTVGARGFLHRELQHSINDIVLDGKTALTGYYTIYLDGMDDNEGFYLDWYDHSIVYTRYIVSTPVEVIKRTRLELADDEYYSIEDMINLAVSTSTAEVNHLVLGGVEHYFVNHLDVVRDYVCDSDLVPISKEICRAADASDHGAITALLPKIDSLSNVYKSLLDLSVRYEEYEAYSLSDGRDICRQSFTAGHGMSRVCVRVMTDEKFRRGHNYYTKLTQRIAAYLLEHTHRNITCIVQVGEDVKEDWNDKGEKIYLYVRDKDLSMKTVIAHLDKVLIQL